MFSSSSFATSDQDNCKAIVQSTRTVPDSPSWYLAVTIPIKIMINRSGCLYLQIYPTGFSNIIIIYLLFTRLTGHLKFLDSNNHIRAPLVILNTGINLNPNSNPMQHPLHAPKIKQIPTSKLPSHSRLHTRISNVNISMIFSKLDMNPFTPTVHVQPTRQAPRS